MGGLAVVLHGAHVEPGAIDDEFAVEQSVRLCRSCMKARGSQPTDGREELDALDRIEAVREAR